MTDTATPKQLVVIDGNSLLYRAFYGVRAFSTTDGLPTNAVYGLAMMLIRLLDGKPDYIVVAFDTPKPTFRHLAYDGYKAQRGPMPVEMIPQTDLARELIAAFSVPVLECEGFEADDIIGAIAKKASTVGLSTTIVTGDLDTLQLVDKYVKVLTTIKGVSETVLYDEAAVRERFGVDPDHMVDYKGLKGDPSDNIPGVPGIGDKTATDLVRRYGSVEEIIEHLEEMPDGRVKRSLIENRDQAILSKHLATIVTDLPMELDLASFAACEPDYERLRDLFVRLEFKTLLKRLPKKPEATQPATSTKGGPLGLCRVIADKKELDDLLAEIETAGECTLVCHASDTKSSRVELAGMSLCTEPGRAAFISLLKPAPDGKQHGLDLDDGYHASLSDLAAFLADSTIAKHCHDLKLCHASLAQRGICLEGIDFDTMLAAYLMEPSRGSYSLRDVTLGYLSLEMPTTSIAPAAHDFAPACAEAEAVYRLTDILRARLEIDGMIDLLENIELPLASILAEMEMTGVAVDVEQLAALSSTMEIDMKHSEQSIYEAAGQEFNIGSPKQMQIVLFEKLGLRASKKTKTGFSTSAAVLEEMAAEYPIVAGILRYRELSKIKSTYADALPKLVDSKTGRLHTSLNQTSTATGRLSSSDPNLQNIPIRTELGRQIRRAFVAPEGKLLLSADYSQIELRVLAHMSGDPAMTEAFSRREDIHLATACTLFGCPEGDVTPEMRRRAKTINFAVIYGMADFTLAHELGISTREARHYIEEYFAKFAGVRTYKEQTLQTARTLGYVGTLSGRRRYVPDVNNSNYNVRMGAERAAVNTPIQGTAADIMKMAMIKVHGALAAEQMKAEIILQVHDELVLELPPNELERTAEIVRREMESAWELSVPLKVDVKSGLNWAEMSIIPEQPLI